MNASVKKILRAMSFVLTSLLLGTTVCVFPNGASDSERELTVNDSETGTDVFTFDFFGKWVHEGGYPERFVGGDEHWTTTNVFGTAYPGVTLRFSGTRAQIFGHKVPEGAMADVTLDGSKVGEVDFYNPVRIEKTLLFDTGNLSDGEHTLTVTLTAAKNPSAGNTHEASIDYAVVTTSKTIPVTGARLSAGSIVLEPDMTYALSYTLLPDYATETPVMVFRSADESVAAVSQDGTVTATGTGQTEITVSPESGGFSASVSVTVREPVGDIWVGRVGDTNTHTLPGDYDAYFASLEKWTEKDIRTVLWQNDRATCKLDIMTKGQPQDGVTVTVGTLTDGYGRVFDGTVTAYFVKNVYAHDTGHMIPDLLDPATAPTDIPARTVTSIWIRIDSTENTQPGFYAGEVTVSAGGTDNRLVFPLRVEVIGLPAPDNTAELELWAYPYSSNRYYSGKDTAEYFGDGKDGVWHTHLDPAYEAGLISQLQLYKAGGGNSVTATIGEDPWNSQTPDPYPSMVKWTRGTDGKFAYDYTDFDYWVELNEKCGIDGRILCFSISDWANSLTYMDARSGKVKTEQLTPGSDRWKTVWGDFLTDFMAHTREKGWFDRVYVSMDERPANVVEAVLDLVESVRDGDGHCFKTSLAVFTFDTEYLFDRVTDLSLAYAMDASKLKTIAAHRRELGLTTTLYTCGAQNSALENQPGESLYSIWYAASEGTDGFLRWAFDAFNDDPRVSSEHRLFAAGDIYLIYPDVKGADTMRACSSARFEKLAEGCRDISKLNMLRQAYPDGVKDLDKTLKSIARSGAGTRSLTSEKATLDSVARRYALERLIKLAGPVTDETVVAAVGTARALLTGKADDSQLADAAAAFSYALYALTREAETSAGQNDTDTETYGDATGTDVPDGENGTTTAGTDVGTRAADTEPDGSAPNGTGEQTDIGCASFGSVPLIVTAAITGGAALCTAKRKKSKRPARDGSRR